MTFLNELIIIVYYVYLLKSINYPDKAYIGYTGNVDLLLSEHNAGLASHTSKYMPWELVTCISFQQQSRALALKSGSGKFFAKKHFW
jgi:putative endonuclease